jgi:hypothetical protein
MGNFLSRLRELIYYTDTEPLEIMSGLFRMLLMWHMGVSPSTVSLALTGVLSIVTAIMGSLSWRNLTNLVGTTVPLALVGTGVMGANPHYHPETLLVVIMTVWCLVRTMTELKSRGYK